MMTVMNIVKPAAAGAGAGRGQPGVGPDARRRLEPRRAVERDHDRHPAAAGPGVRREQRGVAAAQPRPGDRRSAADAARRPARRSRLPAREDAQGRLRQPHRLQRRAQPRASRCAPRRAASASPTRVRTTRGTNSGSGTGTGTWQQRRLAAPADVGGTGTSGSGRLRRDDDRPAAASERAGAPQRSARRARRSTCASRSELSSDTAQVEDRFTATTMVDLYQGNDVLIPAGSTLRGVVSSVNKATRTERKGSADGRVRPDHRPRPELSDPRHRDAGARERRHQG